MTTATMYEQLKDAHNTIQKLSERVAHLGSSLASANAKLVTLSRKCFALNNERAKWEQRYKSVKARLDRLSYPQRELFIDPSGNHVSQEDVAAYYDAMKPTAAVTVAQIGAWVAAGRPQTC